MVLDFFLEVRRTIKLAKSDSPDKILLLFAREYRDDIKVVLSHRGIRLFNRSHLEEQADLVTSAMAVLPATQSQGAFWENQRRFHPE